MTYAVATMFNSANFLPTDVEQHHTSGLTAKAALKRAEDSDALLLRLYEWAGQSGNVAIHIPPGAARATLTNLMEKAEGTPLSLTKNQIDISVHPYEIISVRVDYPRTQ